MSMQAMMGPTPNSSVSDVDEARTAARIRRCDSFCKCLRGGFRGGEPYREPAVAPAVGGGEKLVEDPEAVAALFINCRRPGHQARVRVLWAVAVVAHGDNDSVCIRPHRHGDGRPPV